VQYTTRSKPWVKRSSAGNVKTELVKKMKKRLQRHNTRQVRGGGPRKNTTTEESDATKLKKQGKRITKKEGKKK